MTKLVECDDCGQKYRLPESHEKPTLKCQNCGYAIRTGARRSPPISTPQPQSLQTWQVAAISSATVTLGFLLINWLLPTGQITTSEPIAPANPVVQNEIVGRPASTAPAVNSGNQTHRPRIAEPVNPVQPPPARGLVEAPPAQAERPIQAEQAERDFPRVKLPAVPITEWMTVKPRLRIPTPSRTSSEIEISVSGSPPHFILHDRNLFDVRNDHTIQLPVELNSGKSVVSADGRLVAHVPKEFGNADIIYIYQSMNPDAPPTRIEVEGGAEVDSMKFLDSSRLMAYSDSEWVIWDCKTNLVDDSFKAHRNKKTAVGPGGRFLAIPEINAVRVVDTKSDLAPIELSDTFKGQKISLLSCHAMAFSSDLRELVGIYYPGKVVVWSMETRKIVQLDVLAREPGQYTFTPNQVEWLPDKSGWLLNGNQLLDRKTMLVTWLVVSDRYRPDKSYGMLLSQDQILVVAGERDNRVLAPVQIPWEAIGDAMDRESDRLLRESPLGPGKAISLRVNVQNTRLANQGEVGAAIAEVIETKLESHDITVRPGQPISLLINYSAQLAKQGTSPFDGLFGMGRNRKRIPATQMRIEAKLVMEGFEKPLWKDDIHTPPFMMTGRDLNEQKVRDEAFKKTMEKLQQAAIPTRIVMPGNLLPVRSRVPSTR